MVPTVAGIAAVNLTQKSTDNYDSYLWQAVYVYVVAQSDCLGACSLQPGCLRCTSKMTCTAVNNPNAYALIRGRVVPNAGFTNGPGRTAVRCQVRPLQPALFRAPPHHHANLHSLACYAMHSILPSAHMHARTYACCEGCVNAHKQQDG